MIPIVKKTLSGLIFFLFIATVSGQHLSPTISQETACDGQSLVTICYDLPCDTGFIVIEASTDDGATWTSIGDDWFATFTEIEGDTGTITEFGDHCFIWHAHIDLPDYESRNFQVRYTAGCETMRCPRDRNKILIYVTEDGSHYGVTEMDDVELILESAGFDITLLGRNTVENIAPYITDDLGQFWLICSEYSSHGTFNTEELNAVSEFVENCGNLALFPADAPTYTYDANLIAAEYGVEFSGNIDHSASGASISCNPALWFEDHPITYGLSSLTVTRGESEIHYSGTEGVYQPLTYVHPRGMPTHTDTMHACLEWGNSRLHFDSEWGLFLNAEIHDCDNITYIHNLAAWLAESSIMPGDTVTEITVGVVDTRPPAPELMCPESSVSPGDYVLLEWTIEDMFPTYTGAFITIDDGGMVFPVGIDGSEFMYHMPDDVETVHVQIAVRDSFCNWGYDTCSFGVETFCDVEIPRCWFIEERECDDSNSVFICYTLTSSCPDVMWPVEIEMSPDDGLTWDIPISTISEEYGHIGMVYPGLHCFLWLLSEDMPLFEDSVTLRVSISDSIYAEYEGFLDAAPPRSIVDIDLQPARPLQTREWYLYDYEDPSPSPVTDGFWILELCDSVDTFDLDWDTTEIHLPYIDCPDGRLIVALRDSFCNWSYDTLPLSVTNHPPDIYGCTEDTISICIGDSLHYPLALRDESTDFDLALEVTPDVSISIDDDTLRMFPPDTGIYDIVVTVSDLLGLTSACSLVVQVKSCTPDTGMDVTYDVHRQWNMLSSPLMDTLVIGDVFPAAIPPAYAYNTGSMAYFDVPEVISGIGFWLLSPGDTTCYFHGHSSCLSLDLVLYRGWNLIGPPDIPIPVSRLEAIPEIILPIYTYTSAMAYDEVDTLRPGIGYWILSADTILVPLE